MAHKFHTFMATCLCLWLIGDMAQAQVRPDTRRLYCSEANRLVKQSGALMRAFSGFLPLHGTIDGALSGINASRICGLKMIGEHSRSMEKLK